MNTNKFYKILCSLPVILIALYFIPFIGVCLILFRSFIYNNRKKHNHLIALIVIGIIILIPKILEFVINIVNIKIPYINDILSNDLYNNQLIGYSKLLITVGIILYIISIILNRIFSDVKNKINSTMRTYMNETIKRDTEISQKNDLEMKKKREKAKYTGYVKCPNCGSDNLLSEKFGTCKYCRRKLVNKNSIN